MRCLTAQLGIKVPKENLSKIRYPDGVTGAPRGDRNRTPRDDRHTRQSRRDDRSERESSSVAFRRTPTDRSSRSQRPPPRRRNERDSRPRRKQVKQTAEDDTTAPDQTEEENQTDSDQSQSDTDGHQAKFAVAYSTIDTRDTQYQYQSYSSSEDSPPEKSATTKAKKK
jgi:hypothetical protein